MVCVCVERVCVCVCGEGVCTCMYVPTLVSGLRPIII